MKADDMTFGIEIECQIPETVVRELRVQVGGYHRGIQFPTLPTGWVATSDCSIGHRAGHVGVELVSPILKGRDGIEQVIAVVTKLNEWKVRVDASCGFHVHVGAGMTDTKVLKRLLFLGAKFERALFAVTGTKSREHGHYAAPMTDVYASLRDNCTLDAVGRTSRYHSINLTNLVRTSKTVEFRVFQGTTNLAKILGYIQICLGLCENAHAMKRTPTDSCKNVRHQNGRGLVYRMLRNFNWFSEKRMGDVRFGVLAPEYLKTVKAEMTRLADKYDADTRGNHRAVAPRLAAVGR